MGLGNRAGFILIYYILYILYSDAS
jgi:hypothetical protein